MEYPEPDPPRLVDVAPTADEAPGSPPVTTVTSIAADQDSPAPRISPWTEPQPDDWPVCFAFNLPKIIDQGEDADPLVLAADGTGLLAVFDGMGGAGGTVYQTPTGPRSGAYLAARVARDAVQRRIGDLAAPDMLLDGPTAAADLHRSIQDALADHLAQLHAPPSGLRSKLLRALPTTMALAAVHRLRDAADWTCQLLWAGDSRVYAVTPDSGAHQLTRDDIRDRGDAMTNLRADSVVSNAMSADTPFTVNHHQLSLREPFLLVAASDGCFGYLPSPMHFEHLLLTTLRDAPDTGTWSRQLQERISAFTGDDASMAVLGIGADLDGFRESFADRTARLDEEVVSPLDEISRGITHLEVQLRALQLQHTQTAARLWAAYQPDYQRYLPDTAIIGDHS